MGWERRQGTGYYYRSRRVGGRVVKTYFGRGEVARVAEQLDAADRRRRAAEGAALATERSRLAPAEAALAALDAACDLMLGATLLAAGCRHHHYSWRRGKRVIYQVASNPGPAPTPEEVADLVARARQGDEEVLPRLRAFLDAHPAAWRQCGDLARHALDAWITLVAGPDLVARESFARKAAELTAELAGPDPTPVEKLLVERVVACWLQLHHADAAGAHAGDLSLRQAAFAQKRQDAAHRRYMTALAALATLRRLVPAGVAPAGLPTLTTPFPGLPGTIDEDAKAASQPVGPAAVRDDAVPPEDVVLLAFEPPGAGAEGTARPRRGRRSRTAATS